MRILFDHGTPGGIAPSLAPHKVTEARDRGWDTISNGDLLKAAEAEGFHLLLTTDKRIKYQQNLKDRKIANVVLGNSTWRIVRLHLDRIAAAVNQAEPGSYTEVFIPFKESAASVKKRAPKPLRDWQFASPKGWVPRSSETTISASRWGKTRRRVPLRKLAPQRFVNRKTLMAPF